MGNIKRILRCYKCGTILQDTNPNEEGYITSEILNHHKSEILMCNNCFNKLIYRPNPQGSEIDEDFYSILEDARATDSLIVLVIDLFTFEGFTSEKLNKALGEANVLVVGNKRDLFPKNVDDEVLKEYVYHKLRVSKLNVNEVILTSSVEDYNIDVLLQKVDEIRKRHDVYVLGFPNSGKTSLVNCLLKHFKNKTNRVISTIDYPGTKIRVFEIPLDRTSNLYDVPGMNSNNSVMDYVEPSIASSLLFKKAVEPVTTVLSVGTGLALGGLARIDLIKGNKTKVIIYTSDKVECRSIKAKDIDSAFFTMIKKKYLKPTSKYLTDYDNFDMYDITVDQEGERDIGILGLGWISFKGNNQVFRVSVPKGVYVFTSRAKVKLNVKK